MTDNDDAAAKRRKTIQRIRDLRKLALNNPSPEEAKAALELAASLMTRHGLAEQDVAVRRAPRRPAAPSVDYQQKPASVVDDPQVRERLAKLGISLGKHFVRRQFGLDLTEVAEKVAAGVREKAQTDEEKAVADAWIEKMMGWIR